jgi:hypothetical protein
LKIALLETIPMAHSRTLKKMTAITNPTPSISSNDKKTKLKKIEKLKILQWNCNSITGKCLGLRLLINKQKPDIVVLTEIKCNTALASLFIDKFPEFDSQLFLRDEDGGGAAILIDKTLSYKKVNIPINFGVEAACIKVKINEKFAGIVAWYNKPSNNGISIEFLNWISSSMTEYLVCGDLNAKCIPWCKIGNKAGEMLLEWNDSHDVMVLNDADRPTSFWKSSATPVNNVLDLYVGTQVFTNNLREYKTLTKSPVDIYQASNYHVPVVAIFALKKTKINVNISKNKTFDTAKADWTDFQQTLNAIYPTINTNDNITNIVLNINAAFKTATETAIPLAPTGNTRITNLPRTVMNVIRDKNYWHRRYKRTRRKKARDTYYSLREATRLKLDKYQSDKMKTFVNGLGPAPLSTKPLWRRINRLRNIKRSKQIPTLVKGGIEFEDDESKAKIFADRMTRTFNESKESIDNFDAEFKAKVEEYISKEEYLPSYPDKQVTKFKMKDLKRALKHMNSKTSYDAFGISNLLIKKMPQIFKHLLLEVFNKCLSENFLPDMWKESIIKMIEKKSDDLSDPKNYRPISITSCLMRLLERLILIRLQKHLDNNKILLESQSGFRKNRSTRDNLTFLVQKAQEAKNRGWNAMAIFFDIEAAFDKVWHAGLIYKLVQIRTPLYLLKIIITFLSNRSFQVKVGEKTSDKRKITCGVPQGACLSPTLFAIYINDSPSRSSKNNEQTMLFADDTAYLTLYKKKNNKVNKRVNKFLEELEEWARKWRVTLAPHKCNYIIFSKHDNTEKFSLKLNGQSLEFEKDIRFLGLRLDPKLNFVNQINHIKKTCRERLSIIKVISHKSWHLKEKTLVEIYHAIVRSIMEYSSIIFDLIAEDERKTIDTIQNDALRIIFKKDRDFSNKKLLKLANEITIKARMSKLKNDYLCKALLKKNPLITKAFKEFKEFANGRNVQIKTIFSNYKMLNDSIFDTTTSSFERSNNDARLFGNALV